MIKPMVQHPGSARPQYGRQLLLGDAGAPPADRRAHDGTGFAHQRTRLATGNPVEHVLQSAGQRLVVFRRAEHCEVGPIDLRT